MPHRGGVLGRVRGRSSLGAGSELCAVCHLKKVDFWGMLGGTVSYLGPACQSPRLEDEPVKALSSAHDALAAKEEPGMSPTSVWTLLQSWTCQSS